MVVEKNYCCVMHKKIVGRPGEAMEVQSKCSLRGYNKVGGQNNKINIVSDV